MQKEGQRRSNKASYPFLNTAHNVLLTPLFIFIFLLHYFIIFPPPTPPPHLFYTFFLPPPPPPHFYCFHHQKRVIKLISRVFIRNVSGFIASANIFEIILIKGQKVDLLCLFKKRVWFHCELVLIFL